MKHRGGVYQSDFYLSNGERIRKSLGTRSKAEAKLKEIQMQAEMEAALRNPPAAPVSVPKVVLKATPAQEAQKGPLTLRNAFLKAKVEHEPWRASTAFSTIESNYNHISKDLEKLGGEHLDLASLNREVLLDYAAQLREKGKSPSTINQRLSLISVLLKYAETWTKGQIQPFKMPRQKVRQGRIRILSYAEEERVLHWFLSEERTRERDPDMAELVAFLLDTGFRLSEALGLLSREIDWEGQRVPAWETKANAPRFVKMTGRVSEILARRKHLEHPFGMFSKDSAEDFWDSMRRALKIDPKRDPEFVLHALRHTCASRLVAAGMDAFRVQKWMGHKSIATTQLYVTLFAPDLDALAGALDKARLEAPRGHHQRHTIEASRGVSKSVPRSVTGGTAEGARGRSQVVDPKGLRPESRTGPPVVDRLLIRRSLVRAQVEEPDSSEAPEASPPDSTGDCA